MVSACSAIPPTSSSTAPEASEELAASPAIRAMAGSDGWEFFTDFGDPYGCRWAATLPEQHQAPPVAPKTVWQRIRMGHTLPEVEGQRRLTAQFNWYHRHPEYMLRVSRRAQRYLFHVVEELERRDMPMELAYLPIVESAFDPFAYSHGRAAGMWQFIPGTARYYKLDINWWYDGRRDVIASTRAALDYLEQLHRNNDGDWLLALAAYNSGQGNVNKAVRKNRARGKPTDFWALDLPRETRSYVPKLLALAKLLKHPQRYNIELYPVPNAPYFAAVDTEAQIDLAQAARMAEIDIDELYLLNPGYNRWATAPQGPHRLLVPVSQAPLFHQALAELPAQERVHWQRYTVKSGDSLLLLAKRFRTDVTTIKQVNQLRGNIIRTGQALMIPTAHEGNQHYSLSAEQRLAEIQQRRRGGINSQQQFHTVAEGDSLWTISRQYGVTVSQLASWNGMAPKDMIKPGQKLSVWTTKVTASPRDQRESVVRKVGYQVRSGDSLARIAGRFNVRVSDIVKWNAVDPKHYLQPGQQLTLYVDITNAVN